MDLSILCLQMDLSPFILKAQSECLNEDDDHPFLNCLSAGNGFLQSDCDAQVQNSLVNIFSA